MPHEALDADFIELLRYNNDENIIDNTLFITADNRTVSVKFIAVINNRDGYYNSLMDELCQEYYGIPFSRVRSNWIARFGYISNVWHIIEMKER